MDWIETTDRLIECGIPLRVIAEAAGVSRQTLKQTRLDTSKPQFRKPPPHWRKIVRQVAMERRDNLADLIRDLDAD